MEPAELLSRTEAIEWKGRRLVLPYPSFEVEKAYEHFLKNNALREVLSRRGDMPAADYREAHGAWQRDCAAFRYAWGREVAVESLDHRDGLAEALWLMFTSHPDQRDVKRSDVDAMLRGPSRDAVVEAFNRLFRPDPTTPSASSQGRPGAEG